jgi:hypothetical protein
MKLKIISSIAFLLMITGCGKSPQETALDEINNAKLDVCQTTGYIIKKRITDTLGDGALRKSSSCIITGTTTYAGEMQVEGYIEYYPTGFRLPYIAKVNYDKNKDTVSVLDSDFKGEFSAFMRHLAEQ